MMMSTILAVALGLTPVKEDGRPQVVQVGADATQQIGRYTQTVDRRGLTHVRGFDRLGREYELTLDGKGKVEGTVGPWSVRFQVSQPS